MGDKYMPKGMKQIRAYVPEAVADRLLRVSKSLNVTVTELSGACIAAGIDQAIEDRILVLEKALAALRTETRDDDSARLLETVNGSPAPVRKGRAEKAAEVKREQAAEERRRARSDALSLGKALNRDERTDAEKRSQEKARGTRGTER